MVDPELQDLLPLYLAESRRRLERLLELAPRVDTTATATEARRELHTLKGSSRMLKLYHVAERCHRGETLLQDPNADTPAEFTSLLDQVSRLVEDLGRGDAEAAAASAPRPPGEKPPAGRPAARNGRDGEVPSEYRISAGAADRLTSAMAAMRLLAVAGLGTGRRLVELATIAEEGVTEALPRQVLAMLSSHLRQVAGDLEAGQQRLLRHAESQLTQLLDLQLQPLRPFLQSLARYARELARNLGKEIEVEVEGGEARLDQRIVGELRGAFLHLVANAVDHGVEAPAERLELGKPRTGHLRIAAASCGDRVEIVVTDDGAGVDRHRVLEAAREKDRLPPEIMPSGTGPDGVGTAAAGAPAATDPDDSDLFGLLFTTGFSTRREVSEVSGRGMGLDAVAAVVRQLGGDVWMSSALGKGTSLFVEVPAARRGERVLVLRCGFERLALPKSPVRWVRRAGADELVAGAGGGLLTEVEGELLRVVSVPLLLGQEDPAQTVLIGLEVAGSQRVLAVEAVEGEEEVLVRPFARAAGAQELYAGIALLTSGDPVAVLSPRALTDPLHAARRPPAAAAARPPRLRVLLVEDSLVTREMERRMLEEEGFHVTSTAAAEEALSLLGKEHYDCLVTDLEMPGMDGFELTRRVRATRRLAQLPIVVVSTCETPADRLAGLEAGADVYVSKQSLESHQLAAVIRRLGSGA